LEKIFPKRKSAPKSAIKNDARAKSRRGRVNPK